LEKFTIYYHNIRGIKSKWASLMNIIEEKQPTLVALVETHTKEQEMYERIPGYNIIRRERKEKEGGGIALIYKTSTMQNMITILPSEEENEDIILWIKIANSRIRIKVGIV